MATPSSHASKSFAGASHFFMGVLLVILPIIYLVLMVRNTISIAKSPTAAWWLELWILLFAGWLLLAKRANIQTRFVVELSIFIAALAVFITKLFLDGNCPVS